MCNGDYISHIYIIYIAMYISIYMAIIYSILFSYAQTYILASYPIYFFSLASRHNRQLPDPYLPHLQDEFIFNI